MRFVFIATLYVIQLVWLDRNLKKRKIQFSPAIPPLMAVERHFFCLFAMGEALLTLTLISGTYHVLQAVTPENLHKSEFFLSLLGLVLVLLVLDTGDWAGVEKDDYLRNFGYHSAHDWLFW